MLSTLAKNMVSARDLYFIVAFVLCTSCVSSQWVTEDSNSCRTPNRVQGTCISLRNCPSLLNMLQANGPRVPQEVVNFLQQSQCGFQRKDPLVCCPPQTVTPTPRPTSRPTPSPNPSTPPNVSGHPNLRFLPAETCGHVNNYRIIGGNVTGLFEYPWMALISYNTKTGRAFRCGGTLINNRYILTAAHCVTNLPSGFTLAGVRLGEHNISSKVDCETEGTVRICADPVQDFTIDQAIPHPMYDPKALQYDIALIRLGSNANIDKDNVKPICLPVGSERNMQLKKGFVAGWGVTENGTSSDAMLKVSLPIVTNDRCGSIYNKSAPITYRQMCAGGTMGMDSCSGDSGGPLKSAIVTEANADDIKYVQFGVVSFGPRNCGVEGRPGVYTRVVFFMDWILENLKD